MEINEKIKAKASKNQRTPLNFGFVNPQKVSEASTQLSKSKIEFKT